MKRIILVLFFVTAVVIFLLEVSGSMAGTEGTMVYGVNNLLKKMEEQHKDTQCEIRVSVGALGHQGPPGPVGVSAL